MFYDQLISLCNRDGVKPTPLIRELGFSAGNIKRWENGATVNSDILIAVAEHFKVSIDYLLTGKEKNTSENKLTQNEHEMLEVFQNFDDREQVKIIGRMEEWLEVKHQREAISQKQQIVGVQVARRIDGRFVKEPVTAEEFEKIEALPEDTDY